MSTAQYIWSFIGTVLSLEFLFALLLTGCSAVFVPTYHEAEFNELVTIAAQSARGTCDVAQTQTLQSLTTHLRFYTELSPNNSKLYGGVMDLSATVDELAEKPQPISQTYCSFKLRMINKMARVLGEASGGKPQ
jgi:hypothetical protein